MKKRKTVGLLACVTFAALLRAHERTDFQSQYQAALARYRRNASEYVDVPALVKMAKAAKDEATAKSIAREYIENRLDRLNDQQLLDKSTLIFAAHYVKSTDKIFELFRNHGEAVDAAVGRKSYAASVVGNVIDREEITPFDKFGSWEDADPKPDWGAIRKEVAAKYGDRGLEELYGREMMYYGWGKHGYRDRNAWTDYDKFGKYYTLYYGMITHWVYSTNNLAWDVFLHVSDPKVLEAAIGAMEKRIIKNHEPDAEPPQPTEIDTYANLLYKDGRRVQAIGWERRALYAQVRVVAERPDDRRAKDDEKTFEANLEKIKRCEPTWDVNSLR